MEDHEILSLKKRVEELETQIKNASTEEKLEIINEIFGIMSKLETDLTGLEAEDGED